jgi:hypothetical protein
MTFGTEPDPVDQLDREEERAIAAVVRARFGRGDLRQALNTMDGITTKRLQMRAQQVVRRSA